jgi:mRNA interferase MazF
VIEEAHRGDIWIVDWSRGRGSEQAGMRPALVIQTDAANLNSRYPNTIVLTISTKGKAVPFHISLNHSRESGLKKKSFVKCEQVLTISKDRLVRRVGHLDQKQLGEVEEALRKVLDM